MDLAERSRASIQDHDLVRLRELAMEKIEDLFDRKPYSSEFRGHLCLMCLGQGAALHFLDSNNGVKDFDVWAFYSQVAGKKFPPRLRMIADFGVSDFGRHPEDSNFQGRRVDIMGRDLPFSDSTSVEDTLTKYLGAARTTTAKLLSQKPMIGLWPKRLFRTMLWSGNRTKSEIKE